MSHGSALERPARDNRVCVPAYRFAAAVVVFPLECCIAMHMVRFLDSSFRVL